MFKVSVEIRQGFSTRWDIRQYDNFRDAYVAFYRRYTNPISDKARRVDLIECDDTHPSKILFTQYI